MIFCSLRRILVKVLHQSFSGRRLSVLPFVTSLASSGAQAKTETLMGARRQQGLLLLRQVAPSLLGCSCVYAVVLALRSYQCLDSLTFAPPVSIVVVVLDV